MTPLEHPYSKQSNRSSRPALAAAVAFATSLLVGCAVAPIQEMSDARQALQSARDIGAEQYAPMEVTNAQTELENAERLLGNGKDYYASARDKAMAAKQAAINAREVSANLARAKQAVEQATANGLDTLKWQRALDQAMADAKNGDSDKARSNAINLVDAIDTAIANAKSN